MGRKIDNIILEMKHISKSFPGVQALQNVSFQCKKGEVKALVGENGAGKSTLMKILAGVYQPDEGEIILRREKVQFDNPHDAQKSGISIIYQEGSLLPYLGVAENMFLGREPRKRLGFIDSSTLYREAQKLLDKLKIEIDLTAPVYNLSLAQQRMIEIAKALSLNAELIIMDEPSAALTTEESDRLFQIIHSLKDHGVTVIYISHRMQEIFHIADAVTVLKDGKVVSTSSVEEINEEILIRQMVGRDMEGRFPSKSEVEKKKGLSVVGLCCQEVLHDINLEVRKGEIVGLAGLVGSGRTELAKAIFGVRCPDKGAIHLNGRKIKVKSPRDAINNGIGLVTEDRKKEGLVLGLSVKKNITLPSLGRLSKMGLVSEKGEKRRVKKIIQELDIRTPSMDRQVEYLSGGNQQKVSLAKWLVTESNVIIFDEPTRGIDVGAKFEIYNLILDLARRGKAILMISSELPEILGMSDRIVVMREGKIVGELLPEDATEEKIMSLATGLIKNS